MSLAQAARSLGGALIGADSSFVGVSTDSRCLQPSELFVALSGPHHDGHDFLPAALAHGAAGAVVTHGVQTPLPHIVVTDTRLALGRLAACWRRRFALPVIAVTGSNGKTTVKGMIAAILGQAGVGCITEGNLNNDIGAPLTLLRLREAHRYAVVELGMNRRGEIAYLGAIARPTVAVITNAAAAHLAGVGAVADVAREKGAILTALPADGVAVINADDPHADLWRSLAAPRRCLSFGLQTRADFSADYTPGPQGTLMRMRTPLGEAEVRLPLLGAHSVANALAAVAAASALGAELETARRALEALAPVAGRLELKRGINGACVIDDSYNANPGSLAAALAALALFPGERVLVLGDMAELGETAAENHRCAGELAKAAGVRHLFACGELARLAVESFGRGGRHFADAQALVQALRTRLDADTVVLVKGSRVMQLERVVAAISETPAGGAQAAG